MKTTHSASGESSFWTLALSEADRFRSPPGVREGDEEIKKWLALVEEVRRDEEWQWREEMSYVENKNKGK